jgi:hypothetical protein
LGLPRCKPKNAISEFLYTSQDILWTCCKFIAWKKPHFHLRNRQALMFQLYLCETTLAQTSLWLIHHELLESGTRHTCTNMCEIEQTTLTRLHEDKVKYQNRDYSMALRLKKLSAPSNSRIRLNATSVICPFQTSHSEHGDMSRLPAATLCHGHTAHLLQIDLAARLSSKELDPGGKI